MARELRASFKRFASRAAKARTWFETAGRPEIRVTGALRMSRELSRDSLRLASTGAGCLLAPLLVALRAAGAPRKVLCRLMTSQVGDTDHHVLGVPCHPLPMVHTCSQKPKNRRIYPSVSGPENYRANDSLGNTERSIFSFWQHGTYCMYCSSAGCKPAIMARWCPESRTDGVNGWHATSTHISRSAAVAALRPAERGQASGTTQHGGSSRRHSMPQSRTCSCSCACAPR